MNRIAAIAALLSLSACELLDGLSDDATGDATETTGTSSEVSDGTDGPPAGTDGPGTDDPGTDEPARRTGWTERNHTCYGDGVDVMFIDDDEQTMFIGCGSNADGYGLAYTPDRGETWPDYDTEPRGALGSRVTAIDRSADGLLYVAGQNLNGNDEVVTVDTSVSPWEVGTEFEAGSSISEVQFAGSFAVNSQGMAVVEALNGTQIAVRWSENGSWQDAAGWAGGLSYQMQDMQVHNDAFYATGATMNDAPMLFLPPRNGHVEAEGFNMVVVELDSFAQEMRNLDVDADGNIVVGGIDHGLASGVIYVSNDDPRDAYDYTQVWVEDILSGPTWIDGVCRDGDLVAAVGRFSNNNDPIALLSEDGGDTWRDLTMEFNQSGIPSLYRCEFLDGGDTIAVAGASGFLGFYAR